jgi:hypothetical protein
VAEIGVQEAVQKWIDADGEDADQLARLVNALNNGGAVFLKS